MVFLKLVLLTQVPSIYILIFICYLPWLIKDTYYYRRMLLYAILLEIYILVALFVKAAFAFVIMGIGLLFGLKAGEIFPSLPGILFVSFLAILFVYHLLGVSSEFASNVYVVGQGQDPLL